MAGLRGWVKDLVKQASAVEDPGAAEALERQVRQEVRKMVGKLPEQLEQLLQLALDELPGYLERAVSRMDCPTYRRQCIF